MLLSIWTFSFAKTIVNCELDGQTCVCAVCCVRSQYIFYLHIYYFISFGVFVCRSFPLFHFDGHRILFHSFSLVVHKLLFEIINRRWWWRLFHMICVRTNHACFHRRRMRVVIHTVPLTIAFACVSFHRKMQIECASSCSGAGDNCDTCSR